MKEVSVGLIGGGYCSQAVGWFQAATFVCAVSRMRGWDVG